MKTSALIDQMHHAARQLKVGRRLPDHQELTDAEILQVRDDFRVLLEQPGISADKVAQAMGEGFSRSVLSRFKNMEAPADLGSTVEDTARAVNTFIEMLVQRREAKLPDGFVHTDVARRILTVIQQTAAMGAMAVIFADSGRGKSMTFDAAREMYPGCVLIRANTATKTGASFCRVLAKRLGLRDVDRGWRAMEKVVDRLKGTGRVVLIDEAHKLTDDAFELIRDIHDETGCPVVLAGTIAMQDRIDSSDVHSGQFSSRVALRYNVAEQLTGGESNDPEPLHTIEEIKRLWEADKVRLTTDGREYLARLANLLGFGGLRLAARVLQVAEQIAGGELVNAALLRRVLATLHGQVEAKSMDREVEHQRNILKIA